MVATSFDRVLPQIVERTEAQRPLCQALRACVVVRDLRGRVRLVLDPKPDGALADHLVAQKDALAKELERELPGYFVPPIWTTRGEADEARLARAVVTKARPWDPRLSFMDPDFAPTRDLWRKLESRLSKSAWLDSEPVAAPPWPIDEAPAIIAFYSFKGGIGRTTALASFAWQLAEAGRRVVILDLDLEAPGIGALLGARSGTGLLDLLIDHIAAEKFTLEDALSPASELGEHSETVQVIPAGDLRSDDYLEKLARLDFAVHSALDTSPVERALREILRRIRQRLKPDVILLDARSGIHDLSGLSLGRLAHVDVLLARAGEQSYGGFDLTFRSLLRLKGADNLRAVVVHSMATPGDNSAAKEEQEEFRTKVYRSFQRHLYEDGERRALDDRSAPHTPVVIPYNDALRYFRSLRGLREALTMSHYRELSQRILEKLPGLAEEEVESDEA